MEIRTNRLVLRSWRKEDFEPFAQINADPKVMEYFLAPMSKEESDQMMMRMQAKIEKRGWGLWAISPHDSSELMGFIGLNDVNRETCPTHFSPAVEVGWRLSPAYWGQGFATEGALACLSYAFETLHLSEVVSFTAVQNKKSVAVMERIGMHRNPADDFDHPKIPEGHWLRRQVLYRITKSEWKH